MMTTRSTSRVQTVQTVGMINDEHQQKVDRAVKWLVNDGYEVVSASSSIGMTSTNYGSMSQVITTILARKTEHDEG